MNKPATLFKGYRVDVIVILLLSLAYPVIDWAAVKFLGSIGILNNEDQSPLFYIDFPFLVICCLFLFALLRVRRWVGAQNITVLDKLGFYFALLGAISTGLAAGDHWAAFFRIYFYRLAEDQRMHRMTGIPLSELHRSFPYELLVMPIISSFFFLWNIVCLRLKDKEREWKVVLPREKDPI